MEYIDKELDIIRQKNLFRQTRDFEEVNGIKARFNNKEILIFGSNDYLGLSSDQRIKDVAIKAIQKYGFGSTGSRLTSGSRDIFSELENQISDIKQTQASLLFNTGYTANTGIISSICDDGWSIFSDRYNHASIVDGMMLSKAEIKRYRHCSMESLEKRLKESKSSKKLIVTDGVFSMDGDIAPLLDISFLAKKYQAIVMVDDAHGFGVLGKNGGGTCSHFDISSKIDIQMGTLSKAVGGIGGYVSGDKNIIDYLVNTSRSFIFSTSLPPVSVCCAIEAIKIIKEDEQRRKYLLDISNKMKMDLNNLGFDTGLSNNTPIIPIILKDEKKTLIMSQQLLEDGLYIPAIRQPTVPKGEARLRISLTSLHQKNDIDYALERINKRWTQLQEI